MLASFGNLPLVDLVGVWVAEGWIVYRQVFCAVVSLQYHCSSSIKSLSESLSVFRLNRRIR